ncbi:hypothetical protein Gohar_004370 [Gossypium harknessii]|uniref:Uncharacterized protein n=1 Tax=Gossypium harknessii TaxID=34285 RepID=A0A7J9H605_9ROSI|nr:hypothetical protein [Gossypium harknessii]
MSESEQFMKPTRSIIGGTLDTHYVKLSRRDRTGTPRICKDEWATSSKLSPLYVQSDYKSLG